MQYQSSLDREGLIDLAINQYFANVDKKDLNAVLDCFHDNAMMTVQTSFTVHDGKDNIKRMFTEFMSTFDVIVHRDFTCTVDEANGRITASFIADVTGKDGEITSLHNTNFWRIRDDKFQEIYIYMSGSNVLV
ncbi:MAG: ketosteroid isomerase-like protein [Gammaproteobacteria bacterium]|jgi:ketosteroid isomerase-like protein